MMIETAVYMGPATVLTSVDPFGRVGVLLSDGEQTRAHLALASPYRPAGGDEVLVIGQHLDELYVIGVVRGTALTTFTAHGDLAIEAPNGSITLSSSKRIKLSSEEVVETKSPRIVLRANRLDLCAKQVIQKFHNAFVWISELFQVKSRRIRAVADEGYLLKAQRLHIKTTDNCSIDGKTIHLG